MIKRNWQVMLPILIPLFYFVLVTFIMPRPYFIQPADLEQDYYYGSMLVNDGFPPFGIHHPGTPIYELGALIMKISGNEIENAQTFFNISYFIIALANTVALFIFSKTPEVKKAKGFGVMALLLVVSLPGWLSYSHTFGADSFLTPVVLVMISIFWMSLDFPFTRRLFTWVCVGIIAGLGLAIKLTVLPVCFAIVVCSIIFASITQKKEKFHKGVWLQYFLIPIFSAISFIFFIFPTFARLPQIFINFFQRHEIIPQLSLTMIMNILNIIRIAPYFFPVIMIVLLTGVGLVALFTKEIIASKKSKLPIDPKLLSKNILLFILLISLGYTILAISPLDNNNPTELFDAGVLLRNIIPSSLFLPFSILLLQNFFACKPTYQIKKEWIAVVLGVIIFISSWFGYLIHRQQFIKFEEQLVSNTMSIILTYSNSNSRVAVWDGSPGNLYGEASFHFWGNYNYAREFYDTELLSYFNNLTFFRLRDVPRLLSSSIATNSQSSWLDYWKLLFPSPYYLTPTNELVMGENREEPISAIAVPESEIYLEGTTLDELSQLVSQRFGSYQVVERNIDDENWIIFELSVGE